MEAETTSSSPLGQDGDDDDDNHLSHLELYDAHCHPANRMGSIDTIPQMNAKGLTIFASRGQDQDLISQIASRFSPYKDALDEKSRSKVVVPGFGRHPWYSHELFDDRETSEKVDSIQHYKSVLTTQGEHDEDLLRQLPEPQSLTKFLEMTEQRLRDHPYALVGEIGLDKAFRIPQSWQPEEKAKRDTSVTPGARQGRTLSPYRVQMSHQKIILETQLRLAAKHRRAVSVHGVQAHGAVYEVLSKLWFGKENLSRRQRLRIEKAVAANAEVWDEDSQVQPGQDTPPFPPRICMHSYSGPVEFLREFSKKSVPADIYFSFSEDVNFASTLESKTSGVIRAIPASKLLIETDLGRAGPEMDEKLTSIFHRVCRIRGWNAMEGSSILARNWHSFVFGT